MEAYESEFIEFAIATEVLRFGRFTLKSGRVSPYFFNSGLFDTGAKLAALGRFYARAIVETGVRFDVLFGPAYKGIPLVAAVSIALWETDGRDVPYAFNRKEAKDHGEGGSTVGATLCGRVLIVDDVISAGTSVRESVEIIHRAGATPVGVAISLDRQERGAGGRSAVQEVADSGLEVVAISSLAGLVGYLESRTGRAEELEAIRRYRQDYGVD